MDGLDDKLLAECNRRGLTVDLSPCAMAELLRCGSIRRNVDGNCFIVYHGDEWLLARTDLLDDVGVLIPQMSIEWWRKLRGSNADHFSGLYGGRLRRCAERRSISVIAALTDG